MAGCVVVIHVSAGRLVGVQETEALAIVRQEYRSTHLQRRTQVLKDKK